MNPGPAPVVSNAGPLMVLAKLNLLHLLKELYGEVYFPQSVYEEVVIEGMRQGYEDARTLKLFLDQLGWTPKGVSPPLPAVLESALEKAHVAGEIENAKESAELREVHLDLGERDTLALALLLGSQLVLMDEAIAREIARALGLSVRGSLGILVEAYRRQLIDSDQLRLYFAELARRDDVWISRALIQRIENEILKNTEPEN